MRDENRKRLLSLSFIPHPLGFILHPCFSEVVAHAFDGLARLIRLVGLTVAQSIEVCDGQLLPPFRHIMLCECVLVPALAPLAFKSRIAVRLRFRQTDAHPCIAITQTTAPLY